MSRQLLSYDDLDHITVSEDQYLANLVYQYPHLPVGQIEFLIDTLQIPYDFRITFCRVTKSLPDLVQQIILQHVNDNMLWN
jgi:hypothetical protein